MVDYEIRGRIAYLTLNRPEKRNALNRDMVSHLRQSFMKVASDENVKVVILRAVGKTFCSGADLSSLCRLQQASFQENISDSEALRQLFWQIYTLPKIVVAEVQGDALAGGCGLLTVCDMAFAAPHVRLGYTEVKIGFVPAIVMVFLIRKIGEYQARKLLLTGDVITAEEALSKNLVNAVVDASQLSIHVYERALRWVGDNSAVAMAQTKKMIHDISSMSVKNALKHAVEVNARARTTEDCKKGITAFLEKRKPEW